MPFRLMKLTPDRSCDGEERASAYRRLCQSWLPGIMW
jgi:hypothetical protein